VGDTSARGEGGGGGGGVRAIPVGIINVLTLLGVSTYPPCRRRIYDARSQNDVRDHPHHHTDDSVRRVFSADLFEKRAAVTWTTRCARIFSAPGMPTRASS
jgi:hypothetical protein